MDGSSFAVVDYDGIESTDYDIATENNVGYAGSRIKRKKILQRPVSIEFDYRNYHDIPQVRQMLIGFFTPYKGGTLLVDYMGTKRAIEYEVQKLKFSNRNIHLGGRMEVEIHPAISFETQRKHKGQYNK